MRRFALLLVAMVAASPSIVKGQYAPNNPTYPMTPVYPQPQTQPMPVQQLPIPQASAQVPLQSADPLQLPEPTPQLPTPQAPNKAPMLPMVPPTPAKAIADLPAPLLPPGIPTTKEVPEVVKNSGAKGVVTTPKAAVAASAAGFVTMDDEITTPRETVAGPKQGVMPAKETGTLPTITMDGGTTCFGDSCPAPNKCQFMVFGEYLYWSVHGADVPYAQAYDGVDPFLSVPRGQVGVVSPQYQSGFKVGGGVSFGSGWFVGTFTYFDMDRSGNIAAPPGDVLHNFLVFPNTVNAAGDSLTATADYHIQLYMADFDYKCPIISNDHLQLNWVAGLRYAHLDQNFSETTQITGTTTINSTIGFDGTGPRIGLESEYKICGGFYGYCHGLVDVLFGQFHGNYSERNVFTGLVGQTSITEDRAVPILELEIGAGWKSCDGRFRVSAGYYVGAWFNVMTTTSLQSGIGNANYTTNGNNFRDNITFDGFVAKFEFRF